jgi:hypothetical protein
MYWLCAAAPLPVLAAQQDTTAPALRSRIPGGIVQRLPIDDVRDLLLLRPGSFLMPNGLAAHRGFLLGSEALYIDRVGVSNHLFGTSPLSLPVLSVESALTTVTGGSSAFGNTSAGLLAVDSRAGRGNWLSRVRVASDELTSWSTGSNRIDFASSGGVGSKLGFSAALSAQGNRSTEFVTAFEDVPIYQRSEIDTTVVIRNPSSDPREVSVPRFAVLDDKSRLPKSARDQYDAHIRFDWNPGARSNVFASLLASRDQARSPFGGCGRFCNAFREDAQEASFERSSGVLLGAHRPLANVRGFEVQLQGRVARLQYRRQNGLLASAFTEQNQDPASGFTARDFEFLVHNDDFPIDRARVENFLRNRTSSLTPFDVTRTDLVPAQEFRFNPYAALTSFLTRGFSGRHEFGKETATYARLALQLANSRHDAEVGGEMSWADVAYINVGYQSADMTDLFVEQPRRGALYLRDRFRVGRIAGDVGIRYDRFDPNSDFPVTPGYWNLDDPSSFRRADARGALSPDVLLELGVSSKTSFLISYLVLTQMPSAHAYYSKKNSDYFRFRNTRGSDPFNLPIGLQRTSAGEIALVYAFARSFSVQAGGYIQRHDLTRVFRQLPFEDPTNPGIVAYLNVPSLREGPEYSGVLVRLHGRSDAEDGWHVAYGYEKAGDPPPASAVIPFSPDDARHTLTGYVSYDLGRLSGWSPARGLQLAATARAASRHHFIAGIDPFLSEPVLGATNGFAEVDIRLSRTIRVGGITGAFLIDARNLLGSYPSGGGINEQTLIFAVAAERQTLGGGLAQDAVNLLDLSSAQRSANVRNEADLAALRQAERLFGNGDRNFSAEEQERAFRAAHHFRLATTAPAGTQRRVRLGLELQF